MSDMFDKNGHPLKGCARWLRQISSDGGMEAHDKKIAMRVFSDFLDTYPEVSEVISNKEAEKRRNQFKVVG